MSTAYLDKDLKRKVSLTSRTGSASGDIDKVIFPNTMQVGLDDPTFQSKITAYGQIETHRSVEAATFISAIEGFSGSLTRLTDDSSYIVAGSNITVTSASNGQVTISATGGGGGSTNPGGSNTQIQYNDGGSTFGGISALQG